MTDEQRYPKGNCIAIYPNGDDSFDVYLGKDVEDYMVFQYGVNDEGKNTFVYLVPPKGMPITISTLILPTTTKGAMPYRCGSVTDVELIQSSASTAKKVKKRETQSFSYHRGKVKKND